MITSHLVCEIMKKFRKTFFLKVLFRRKQRTILLMKEPRNQHREDPDLFVASTLKS